MRTHMRAALRSSTRRSGPSIKWVQWLHSRWITLPLAAALSLPVGAPAALAYGPATQLRPSPAAAGIQAPGLVLRDLLRANLVPEMPLTEDVFRQTGVVLIDRRVLEADGSVPILIDQYYEQIAQKLGVPVAEAPGKAPFKLALYDPEATSLAQAQERLQELVKRKQGILSQLFSDTAGTAPVLTIQAEWFAGGVVYGHNPSTVRTQLDALKAAAEAAAQPKPAVPVQPPSNIPGAWTASVDGNLLVARVTGGDRNWHHFPGPRADKRLGGPIAHGMGTMTHVLAALEARYPNYRLAHDRPWTVERDATRTSKRTNRPYGGFLSMVKMGDTIEPVFEETQHRPDGTITLDFAGVKQEGTVVVEGVATLEPRQPGEPGWRSVSSTTQAQRFAAAHERAKNILPFEDEPTPFFEQGFTTTLNTWPSTTVEPSGTVTPEFLEDAAALHEALAASSELLATGALTYGSSNFASGSWILTGAGMTSLGAPIKAGDQLTVTAKVTKYDVRPASDVSQPSATWMTVEFEARNEANEFVFSGYIVKTTKEQPPASTVSAGSPSVQASVAALAVPLDQAYARLVQADTTGKQSVDAIMSAQVKLADGPERDAVRNLLARHRLGASTHGETLAALTSTRDRFGFPLDANLVDTWLRMLEAPQLQATPQRLEPLTGKLITETLRRAMGNRMTIGVASSPSITEPRLDYEPDGQGYGMSSGKPHLSLYQGQGSPHDLLRKVIEMQPHLTRTGQGIQSSYTFPNDPLLQALRTAAIELARVHAPELVPQDAATASQMTTPEMDSSGKQTIVEEFVGTLRALGVTVRTAGSPELKDFGSSRVDVLYEPGPAGRATVTLQHDPARKPHVSTALEAMYLAPSMPEPVRHAVRDLLRRRSPLHFAKLAIREIVDTLKTIDGLTVDVRYLSTTPQAPGALVQYVLLNGRANLLVRVPIEPAPHVEILRALVWNEKQKGLPQDIVAKAVALAEEWAPEALESATPAPLLVVQPSPAARAAHPPSAPARSTATPPSAAPASRLTMAELKQRLRAAASARTDVTWRRLTSPRAIDIQVSRGGHPRTLYIVIKHGDAVTPVDLLGALIERTLDNNGLVHQAVVALAKEHAPVVHERWKNRLTGAQLQAWLEERHGVVYHVTGEGIQVQVPQEGAIRFRLLVGTNHQPNHRDYARRLLEALVRAANLPADLRSAAITLAQAHEPELLTPAQAQQPAPQAAQPRAPAAAKPASRPAPKPSNGALTRFRIEDGFSGKPVMRISLAADGLTFDRVEHAIRTSPAQRVELHLPTGLDADQLGDAAHRERILARLRNAVPPEALSEPVSGDDQPSSTGSGAPDAQASLAPAPALRDGVPAYAQLAEVDPDGQFAVNGVMGSMVRRNVHQADQQAAQDILAQARLGLIDQATAVQRLTALRGSLGLFTVDAGLAQAWVLKTGQPVAKLRADMPQAHLGESQQNAPREPQWTVYEGRLSGQAPDFGQGLIMAPYEPGNGWPGPFTWDEAIAQIRASVLEPVSALLPGEREPRSYASRAAAIAGLIRQRRLAEYADVVTPEAQALIEHVTARYIDGRNRLLQERATRRTRIAAGEEHLDFLPAEASVTDQAGNVLTASDVREDDWFAGPIPADLQKQYVQLTGPAESLGMLARALNSGADGYMPDGEDALSQAGTRSLETIRSLTAAIHEDPAFLAEEQAKSYTHDRAAWPALFYRPRGLHLEDRHLVVNGEPVPAAIADAVLYLWHNAKTLLAQGRTPALYLPKIETHQEAALWGALLLETEKALEIPENSVKVFVLVERIHATFELEEIVWALKDRIVGINAGRWDYINSYLDVFRADPDVILPDRSQVTMDQAFLDAYVKRVARIAAKREILFIGGMAAQIPSKDEAINERAMEKVITDKQREVAEGASGAWVAHPGMVSVVQPVFRETLQGAPNQMARELGPVTYTEADRAALLAPHQGEVTDAGLRENVSAALQYIKAYLDGNGAVAIFNEKQQLQLMEDLATAEISFRQLREWAHKNPVTAEGGKFTMTAFETLLDEELAKLNASGDYALAGSLLRRAVTAGALVPWLSELANAALDAREYGGEAGTPILFHLEPGASLESLEASDGTPVQPQYMVFEGRLEDRFGMNLIVGPYEPDAGHDPLTADEALEAIRQSPLQSVSLILPEQGVQRISISREEAIREFQALLPPSTAGNVTTEPEGSLGAVLGERTEALLQAFLSGQDLAPIVKAYDELEAGDTVMFIRLPPDAAQARAFVSHVLELIKARGYIPTVLLDPKEQPNVGYAVVIEQGEGVNVSTLLTIGQFVPQLGPAGDADAHGKISERHVISRSDVSRGDMLLLKMPAQQEAGGFPVGVGEKVEVNSSALRKALGPDLRKLLRDDLPEWLQGTVINAQFGGYQILYWTPVHTDTSHYHGYAVPMGFSNFDKGLSNGSIRRLGRGVEQPRGSGGLYGAKPGGSAEDVIRGVFRFSALLRQAREGMLSVGSYRQVVRPLVGERTTQRDFEDLREYGVLQQTSTGHLLAPEMTLESSLAAIEAAAPAPAVAPAEVPAGPRFTIRGTEVWDAGAMVPALVIEPAADGEAPEETLSVHGVIMKLLGSPSSLRHISLALPDGQTLDFASAREAIQDLSDRLITNKGSIAEAILDLSLARERLGDQPFTIAQMGQPGSWRRTRPDGQPYGATAHRREVSTAVSLGILTQEPVPGQARTSQYRPSEAFLRATPEAIAKVLNLPEVQRATISAEQLPRLQETVLQLLAGTTEAPSAAKDSEAVLAAGDSSPPAERRLPIDSDDPLNPDSRRSLLFSPQLLAIGTATGSLRMTSDRMNELIHIRAGSTFLKDRLGIHERRFIHPDQKLGDLASRAVVALILNHLSSLPEEEFRTIAQAQLPPRLSSSVDLRMTSEDQGPARIQALRQLFTDAEDPDDAIARTFGPGILADVDSMVVVSSTPEDLLVGAGSNVQHALVDRYGLPAGIPIHNENNVCAGCGFGIGVSQALLMTGRPQVLQITADAYSEFLDLGVHKTGPLFGDVATAMLFGAPEPKRTINGFKVRALPNVVRWSDGRVEEFITRPFGYEHFDMDGRTVAEFGGHVVSVVKEYLRRVGLTMDDVDFILPHQPQKGMLRGELSRGLETGELINITPDGRFTIEDTEFTGRSRAKIVWIGQQLANGGAAASAAALNLALLARDAQGRSLLRPTKEKPVVMLQVAFGGGASISVTGWVVQQPGASWSLTLDQKTQARATGLLPVDGDGPVDARALAVNAATADPRYPGLPDPILKSYRLEHLRWTGERWDEPDLSPNNLTSFYIDLDVEKGEFSFEEVALVGFGHQGADKAREIANMPGNRVIHVFTRSETNFRDMLKSLENRLRPEEYGPLSQRLLWHSVNDLEEVLRQERLDLLFEVAPEDAKVDILSRAWSVSPWMAIVTNTSSRHVLQFGREAAGRAVRQDRNVAPEDYAAWIEDRLELLIVQHDHSPDVNKLDDISDPRKRRIDPRLYKAIYDFDHANHKVIAYVDDQFPMYAGNRLAFGGLVREALRLIRQERATWAEIHAAATLDEGLASSHYAAPLPPIGFDPLVMAKDVGWDVTDEILKSHQEYYGRRSSFADPALSVHAGVREQAGPAESEPVLPERVLALRERLWLALFAEYFRLIEDGTLRHPRYGDFALSWFNIDLVTGGALQLADDLGIPQLVTRLQALSNNSGGPSYWPSKTVIAMAEAGDTFESKYGWPTDTAPQGETARALSWKDEYPAHPELYDALPAGGDLIWQSPPIVGVGGAGVSRLEFPPQVYQLIGERILNGPDQETAFKHLLSVLRSHARGSALAVAGVEPLVFHDPALAALLVELPIGKGAALRVQGVGQAMFLPVLELARAALPKEQLPVEVGERDEFLWHVLMRRYHGEISPERALMIFTGVGVDRAKAIDIVERVSALKGATVDGALAWQAADRFVNGDAPAEMPPMGENGFVSAVHRVLGRLVLGELSGSDALAQLKEALAASGKSSDLAHVLLVLASPHHRKGIGDNIISTYMVTETLEYLPKQLPAGLPPVEMREFVEKVFLQLYVVGTSQNSYDRVSAVEHIAATLTAAGMPKAIAVAMTDRAAAQRWGDWHWHGQPTAQQNALIRQLAGIDMVLRSILTEWVFTLQGPESAHVTDAEIHEGIRAVLRNHKADERQAALIMERVAMEEQPAFSWTGLPRETADRINAAARALQGQVRGQLSAQELAELVRHVLAAVVRGEREPSHAVAVLSAAGVAHAQLVEELGKLADVLEAPVRRRLAETALVPPGLVTVDVASDGVATLTLNRPDQLNALNDDLLLVLYQQLERLEADPAVKAVVLTGAGRAFVAGADIEALNASRNQGFDVSLTGQLVFRRIAEFTKPVVAAVNGFALGGGNELAMAAHYRVAGPNAVFGQPEILLGIIPGYAGTQRLARLLNPRAAALIALSGDQINSRKAFAYGLVDERADDPVARAREIAHDLAQGTLTQAEIAAARTERTQKLVPPARDVPLAEDPVIARLVAENQERKQGEAAARILQAIEEGAGRKPHAGEFVEALLFAEAMHSKEAEAGLKHYVDTRRPNPPAALPALLPMTARENIPGTRKAWVIRQSAPAGTAEQAMTLEALPQLDIRDDEVLIEVHASPAEANAGRWLPERTPADILAAHGQPYHVAGNNAVGVIIARGALVPELPHTALGAEVVTHNASTADPYDGRMLLGLPDMPLFVRAYDSFGADAASPQRSGAYATHVTAHYAELMPMPVNLTEAQAAAYPLPDPTIRHNARRSRIGKGDTVLVTGAAGSTGTRAIRIWKTLGVRRVIGLVSTPEKQAAIERFSDPASGFEVVGLLRSQFDFSKTKDVDRFVEEVKQLNGGHPADVALDFFGEYYPNAFLRAVKQGNAAKGITSVGRFTWYGAELNPTVVVHGVAGSASVKDMFAAVEQVRNLPQTEELLTAAPHVLGDTVDAHLAIESARDNRKDLIAIKRVLTYGGDDNHTLQVLQQAAVRGAHVAVIVKDAMAAEHLAAFIRGNRIFQGIVPEGGIIDLSRLTANGVIDERGLLAAVRKALGDRPDVIVERAHADALLGLPEGTKTLNTSYFRLLRSGGQVIFTEDTSDEIFTMDMRGWVRQMDVLFPTKFMIGTHYASQTESWLANEAVRTGLVPVDEPTVMGFADIPKGLGQQGDGKIVFAHDDLAAHLGPTLIVGVPTEVKAGETRVGLTDEGVRALTSQGVTVIVQRGAGLLSNVSDEAYEAAGATLVKTAAEVYAQADLIQKVKELQPEESPLVEKGKLVFQFTHFPADQALTQAALDTHATFLTFENVKTPEGRRPILEAMSQIAGTTAADVAAYWLTYGDPEGDEALGDARVNDPGLVVWDRIKTRHPRREPAIRAGGKRIVILGVGGVAGRAATSQLLDYGALITGTELSGRAVALQEQMPSITVINSENAAAKRGELLLADVIISAVYNGGQTPRELGAELLKELSVRDNPPLLIDISVDNGGGIAYEPPSTNGTVEHAAGVSTHEHPFIRDAYGLLHYRVPNIPAAVGPYASAALEAATLPYTLELVRGLDAAIAAKPELQGAVSITGGRVADPLVVKAHPVLADKALVVSGGSIQPGEVTAGAPDERMVYFFGGGRSDGMTKIADPSLRLDLLGGKGAGMQEMADPTDLDLPVPPGYTITAKTGLRYLASGESPKDRVLPEGLEAEVTANLKELEAVRGRTFGGRTSPLLVSVRSGARISMPGMMDTVLNLGVNDETVLGLAEMYNNPRMAWDSYRRGIQSFGDIVLGIDKAKFKAILQAAMADAGVSREGDLPAEILQARVVPQYKALIEAETGGSFPQDVREQLWGAIRAVFESWNAQRAKDFRESERQEGQDIPEDMGTAVSIVSMVFGNTGDDSGTGVYFTRDSSTGENVPYGEYLANAQGEDVVSGEYETQNIQALKDTMPEIYEQLIAIGEKLERHYKNMMDIEFTVEEGRLWVLQTRSGKRTGPAAIKIAVDQAKEGLITKAEVFGRVQAPDIIQALHDRVDPKAVGTVLGHGQAASFGAAIGTPVFTQDEAVQAKQRGEAVALVRNETSPDDVAGMLASAAIMTAKGGGASHAMIVAKSKRKVAVAGVSGLEINEQAGTFRLGGHTVKRGDSITLDANSKTVYLGAMPLIKPVPLPELDELLRWANEISAVKVRVNADNAEEAATGRNFGAVGVGLARIEHMFFKEELLPTFQELILLRNDPSKLPDVLARIERVLQKHFEGMFQVMDGLPVTIRLMDPPMHEFLWSTWTAKSRVALELEIRDLELKLLALAQAAPGAPARDPRQLALSEDMLAAPRVTLDAANRADLEALLAEKRQLLETAKELEEHNPMMGVRGARVGIMYPDITRMQARAILAAAETVSREGISVHPEIMIPMVFGVEEFEHQRVLIEEIAGAVLKSRGARERVPYTIGTMIETPGAAMDAERLSSTAQFFSIGSNDLTQMTLGLSRDDAQKIIERYEQEKIFTVDPFQTLNPRVEKMMRIAVTDGRRAKPDLKIGICGEHGGDPASILMAHDDGLDYVSASGDGVPIAWLAAAQAQLAHPRAKPAAAPVRPVDGGSGTGPGTGASGVLLWLDGQAAPRTVEQIAVGNAIPVDKAQARVDTLLAHGLIEPRAGDWFPAQYGLQSWTKRPGQWTAVVEALSATEATPVSGGHAIRQPKAGAAEALAGLRTRALREEVRERVAPKIDESAGATQQPAVDEWRIIYLGPETFFGTLAVSDSVTTAFLQPGAAGQGGGLLFSEAFAAALGGGAVTADAKPLPPGAPPRITIDMTALAVSRKPHTAEVEAFLSRYAAEVEASP